MNQNTELVEQIGRAQGDLQAIDQLVRQYLPFIKSETAKFLHRNPVEGVDDELSIAMFAFHEAVQSYKKSRGNFISFASVGIRNRLIDYYRVEKRQKGVISLDQSDSGEEDGPSLLEKTASAQNEIDDLEIRLATREEIREFSTQLNGFGITLGEVAASCPKQTRTLAACHRALQYAREHPELIQIFLSGKKLPIAQLTSGAGVERKTLERHRNYMVAILLAYTNGFEIIRGHLCQIAPAKGGK